MKTYTEFQNRRKILLNLIGDGIAIISNSDESSRNRDCNYPFRSDSYFHYLSGFPEPETVIFLVGGNKLLFFVNQKIRVKKYGMVIFMALKKPQRNFYLMRLIHLIKLIS